MKEPLVSKDPTFRSIKDEAYAANMEIPKHGLALYTWGNVSAFDPDLGAFAIKPSGVEYEDLRPDSMVVVDLDGKVLEGEYRPSSDTKTHLALYRTFSELRGIVHTHSPHAVAWAQTNRNIPAYGTTHADHCDGPIPCTRILTRDEVESDYEAFTGTVIVERFARLDPVAVPMVLVAGHGPFAWGPSAAKAVYNGVVLEEIARMAWMTEAIHPGARDLPSYILRKHYERKHGKNAYYGQK